MTELEKGFLITGLRLLKRKIEKRNELRARHIANPNHRDEALNEVTRNRYREQKEKVHKINILIADIATK